MPEHPQHQSSFKRHELILSLSPLTLNQDLIKQIEKTLGLSFLSEEPPHRVCFANQNSELQDAYKQVFSARDLLDYVYAILGAETKYIENDQLRNSTAIPSPTANLIFWQWVRIGQNDRASRA
jgi:hypothetical protein